jgi:hypothetical protein
MKKKIHEIIIRRKNLEANFPAPEKKALIEKTGLSWPKTEMIPPERNVWSRMYRAPNTRKTFGKSVSPKWIR